MYRVSLFAFTIILFPFAASAQQGPALDAADEAAVPPTDYAVDVANAYMFAIGKLSERTGMSSADLIATLGSAVPVVDDDQVTIIGPLAWPNDCGAEVVARALCVATRLSVLFGESPTNLDLRFAGSHDLGMDDPTSVIHFNQYFDGKRVLGSQVVIVGNSENVFSISGFLAAASSLPDCREHRDDSVIDPTSGRCLTVIATERGQRYWDEEHGTEIAIGSSARPWSVSRSVQTYVYSDANAFSPTYGTTTEQVPISCLDAQGGIGPCLSGQGNNCTYNMKEESGADRIETVYTISSEAPITEAGSCLYGPWSSPTNWPAAGANAYANVRKLRTTKLHESSYLNHIAASEPITVNVQQPAFSTDDAILGLYTPADNQIGFRNDYPYESYKDLRLIAHEFGHHVEDMVRGTLSLSGPVSEGWADSYAMRLIIYNTYVSQIWSGSYSMTMEGPDSYRPWRHTQISRNGERLLGVMNQTGSEPLFYYPGPNCGTSDHSCGDIIPQVYWELVWNSCRTSYGVCGSGTTIVQSGSYASSAWRLANSAFSNAVENTANNGSIHDYFAAVEAMYVAFTSYGYLDSASLDRVRSVMAHHCVGSTQTCSVAYKLPGSPLGALGTWKVRAAEGEDGTNTGNVTDYSGTGTSGNGYSRFALVPTASSVYTIALPATFPTSQSYKGKIVARCITGPCQVMLKVNGVTSGSNLVVPASWSWIASTSVTLPGNQSHSLTVTLQAGTVDVDFVTFEPN